MIGYDDRPGTLYRIYGDGDDLLYVGASINAFTRLAAHKCRQDWWTTATRVTLAHFATRREALRAEVDAIASEAPRFNRTAGGRDGGHRLVCPACSTVLAERRPDDRGWAWTGERRVAA